MAWTDHPIYTFITGIGVGFAACVAIEVGKGIFTNESLERKVNELSQKVEDQKEMIKERNIQINNQSEMIMDAKSTIQAYQQNYPNFRKEVDDFKLNLDKKTQLIDYYNKNCSIRVQIKDLELQRIGAKNSINMRSNTADVFGGNGNAQGNTDLQAIDNRLLELTKKLNCEPTSN